MNRDGNNISLVKRGGFLKQSVMQGTTLNLLVQKKGLEVILHHLEDGQNWVVGPTEGWDGLEFVYILSGSLSWNEGTINKTAYEGDQLIMDPILQDTFFVANGETSFLYIVSQSIFDQYNDQVQSYMDLAIAVEEKDEYTVGHCKRIMDYSMKIGKKLGLSTEELYTLNIGSFLHDVGKIKIPDAILNKPGKLTSEEYEIIKGHTTHGGDLLRSAELPLLHDVAKIVEQHHERYDGSGYPLGLKGDEISLAASIVAVVDSFDAMTSIRVYSKGRSIDDALEEIKNERGRLFHPNVVDAFLELMSNNQLQ